jgi:hypothetical protein
MRQPLHPAAFSLQELKELRAERLKLFIRIFSTEEKRGDLASLRERISVRLSLETRTPFAQVLV